MFRILNITILLLTTGMVLHASDFDITKYGAVGDEKTLNTSFIQQAIDDCNKKGGGNVVFPPGKYLSGTIVLKDNVVLVLKKDAVLVGSTNFYDYLNKNPFTYGLGAYVGWALVVTVDLKKFGIGGE